MANALFSDLPAASSVGTADIVPIEQSGVTKQATGSMFASLAAAVFSRAVMGRLTLTSATPVTTTNVTAATTIYFTPYGGNLIGLYDGTNWQTVTFTEKSLAVPATTNTVYDVFGYLSGGTLALEALAWTNDTARATALALQDGVYVKNGVATRRYLGSFRTTGVSGQTEDSDVKRYVWNYYNRVVRNMRVLEATATWTYSTPAYRQANNAAANQLDFVVGVAEDVIPVAVRASASNSTATTRPVYVSVGLDSTTVAATGSMTTQAGVTNASQMAVTAAFNYTPTVGRHYLVWLEFGTGVDTQTWYGSTGAVNGIFGTIRG